MSIAAKPRERAVRLTAEAREALRQALNACWHQSGAPGRLTREARADLMGVSIATANRILDGEGVDRSTLTNVFQ